MARVPLRLPGARILEPSVLPFTQDLQDILREAIASDTVSIIDCPVDYRENIKLTEQMGNLVCPT